MFGSRFMFSKELSYQRYNQDERNIYIYIYVCVCVCACVCVCISLILYVLPVITILALLQLVYWGTSKSYYDEDPQYILVYIYIYICVCVCVCVLCVFACVLKWTGLWGLVWVSFQPCGDTPVCRTWFSCSTKQIYLTDW